MDRVAGTMNVHAAYRLTVPRLTTKPLARLAEFAERYPSKKERENKTRRCPIAAISAEKKKTVVIVITQSLVYKWKQIFARSELFPEKRLEKMFAFTRASIYIKLLGLPCNWITSPFHFRPSRYNNIAVNKAAAFFHNTPD